MARTLSNTNVVIIGGGVGSSTFTRALKGLPVNLSTIVSSFDDGGSTGSLRRDYGGFALGDFRQCILASLNASMSDHEFLNYRFGKGMLYGTNVGNIFLKAYLMHYKNQRVAVKKLHEYLGLSNTILPITYSFAKLQAVLKNGKTLKDQHEIATYVSFAQAQIKELRLSRDTVLNPDAKKALVHAGTMLFAPGHFFTSILPHLYVNGFAQAWKQSRAHKIWFVNLLAHKGQDSFYTLKDYFVWFERALGKKPFDTIVLNKEVPRRLVNQVRDRFEPLAITTNDIKYIKKQKINIVSADLVSTTVRKQQQHDVVLRAPLRHDADKISKFFKTLYA